MKKIFIPAVAAVVGTIAAVAAINRKKRAC